MIIRRKSKNGERGQVLILCAVSLLVLLLFVGLAIDFGLAYVTKARLGKAADAAALSGAKALYLGQDAATLVAQSAFAMNYGSSTPVATAAVTYSPDGTLINVQGNATNKPFFLPFNLPVGAAAQATRAHVIMTLVLDRSWSMKPISQGGDGGGDALPGAVNSFISHFDDTFDSVAVVSFASTVSVDRIMKTGGFKADILTDTAKMNPGYFDGHTFSDGGLKEGLKQNSTAVTTKGNLLKIVVFFTDGYANTIHQDSIVCGGASDSQTSGAWNIGGYDPPPIKVGFMNPVSGAEKCTMIGTTNTCCTGTFAAASQQGNPVTINQPNVKAEAEYRAVMDSNDMRDQNMVVYSIGLGTPSSPAVTGTINEQFLYQVANDPRSGATFDPNKPVGEADFAPTPADMQAIFDKLAYKILLRMTQ